MAATVVGAKAISVAKSIAPHCTDCAALTGMAGKSISFGLGIGLGSVMPFVLVAGGMYMVSVLMRKHMDKDIIMNSDQSGDGSVKNPGSFASFFGRETVL